MARSSRLTPQHPATLRAQGAGVLREQVHDPYQLKGKLAAGTHCRHCHASVQHGRWQWSDEPAEGRSTLCPACKRMQVDDAAGVLWLDAELIAEFGPQIRAVIDRVTRNESSDHPLERLMEEPGATEQGQWIVQTTGLHLLRRLAHALERSFPARLETRYLQGQTRAIMRLHRTPNAHLE